MQQDNRRIYTSPHQTDIPAYIRCFDRRENNDEAVAKEFSHLQTELLSSFPDCFPGAVRESKRGTHVALTQSYFLLHLNDAPAKLRLEMLVYTPDNTSPPELVARFPQGNILFELYARCPAGGSQEHMYRECIEAFATRNNLQRIDKGARQ